MESSTQVRGKTKVIRVYVCPHEDCTNYFGSSSMGSLDKPNFQAIMRHDEHTNPAKPKIESYRIDCPDCRAAGRGIIKRIACAVRIAVTPEGTTA